MILLRVTVPHRLLHFVKIKFGDTFSKQSTNAMTKAKANKFVKLFAQVHLLHTQHSSLFCSSTISLSVSVSLFVSLSLSLLNLTFHQKILRKLKSKRVLTSMESFGTVAGEAIALEKSSDRLISKEAEMNLMASNQLLTPKPVETVEPVVLVKSIDVPISDELKIIHVKSPHPKPHPPPNVRRATTIASAITNLKRPTRFLDGNLPRPPSPEIGKFASAKITSPSRTKPLQTEAETPLKSSLDRDLEEIREGVLMGLLGGEARA
jgi:hypothetical protein